MISLDEATVGSAAPNADAVKNGRALFHKGKFLALHVDADETVLFGQCQGSGKEPYECSCDFQRPEAPTHRCSCPSRQFPCKHCVGLMFAWVLKRAAFSTAPVPESLAAKRDKLAAREEVKKVVSDKPKKVNKSALAKKIQAQLEGLDLLERLTLDLVRLGIGAMNAKTAHEIEDKAKRLGDAYLPGAQAALHGYTRRFARDDEDAADRSASMARRETLFSESLDQLCRLRALVKQGRAYLERRLEDPDLKPETDSAIAAWLGHAWQLAELKAAGLVESDVELIQLSFNSHDDVARKEFVDTGVWMNLSNGRIALTHNYRPYRAARHMRADDSFFRVVVAPELCVYPGDVNPRIRWETMTARDVQSDDLRKVREFARGDFAAVVKDVKNGLKAPLGDKRPIHALRFRHVGRVDGRYVVEDSQGVRLVLSDTGCDEEPATCHLLRMLPAKMLEDQTLIVRFRHDLLDRQLRVKPLAFVTDSSVVRLTW